MPGASQSQLSEFFGSARQSRPTIYIAGRLNNVELSSYVSAYFLSAGVTSTATQTNSYTLRLRQAWGQAKFDNGWKFLGGQAWSLVTEGKAGISLPATTRAASMTLAPLPSIPDTTSASVSRASLDCASPRTSAIKFPSPSPLKTRKARSPATTTPINFLLGEAGASSSYNTTSNLHRPTLRLISSPRLPSIPALDTMRSSACSTASPTASFRAWRTTPAPLAAL